MAYDATKMKDWQISEAAEENMPTPEEWKEKLGLQKEEVLPYGRIARLDKMLEKLSEIYNNEIETAMNGIVSLLEPALIILMGLIIGFIVIAMFLPLLSLLNALGGI